MATELAKAYVQIIPSAEGMTGNIADALSGEADAAGKSGGKSYASSFGAMAKKALVGLGIGKVVKDAIGDASAFETSMAKTSTLFTGTADQFSALQNQILQLSSTYGLAATTLAEAAYSAESASVPMEDLGAMLESSAKLATAGFTDIDTALSATAKTMNAYGITGAEAMESVQKVLMQTQNLGITTVGELGASLANVTPTAAAMGVSFEQVGAAMAQMTAQGVPTAQATTQLRSAMTELGKSGTKADLAFREAAKGTQYADKSFQEAISSGANLGDVFGMMQAYADKSGKSMVDLWGSVEAGNAAMMIASDLETFNKDLEHMSESANVVDEAYNKMADTFGNSMNRLKESAKNFMTTLFTGGDISASFDAMLQSLGDVGAKLTDWLTTGLKNLGENLPDMMESLLHFGEGLLDALGNVDWISVGTTIVNGIIGAMGTLGSHLMELFGSAINSLVNGGVDFAAIGEAIWGGVTSIITTAGDWLGTLFESAKNAVSNIDFAAIGQTILGGIQSVLDAGGQFLAKLFGFGKDAASDEGMGYADIGKAIKTAVEGVLGAAGDFLKDIFDGGKQGVEQEALTWNTVGEAITTAVNLGLKGGQFLAEVFEAGAQLIEAINWQNVGTHVEDMIVAGLDGASTLIATFTSAAERLVTSVNWEEVGTSAGDLIIAGITAVTDIVNAVSGAANDLITGIKWGEIGQKSGNLLVAGIEGATNLVNAISTAADQLITGIGWQSIGGEITNLLNAGLAGASKLVLTVGAAANRLITNIAWEDIGRSASDLLTSGLSGAANVLDTGFRSAVAFLEGVQWGDIGSKISSGLGEVWSGITGFIGGILGGAGDAVQGFGSGVGSTFEGIGEAIGKLFSGDDAKEAAKNLQKTMEDLDKAMEDGEKTIKETAKGVGTSIKTSIEGVLTPETMKTIGSSAGSNVVAGFNDSDIPGKLSTMMDTAISSITTKDWTSTGNSVVNDISAGITSNANVVNGMKAQADAAYAAFSADWGSLGGNIVDGIVSGLSSSTARLVIAVAAMAAAALSAAKKALGIKSPSKVMRDEVGRYIPEGIAMGIEQNSGFVTDAMTDLSSDIASVDMVGAAVSQGASLGAAAGEAAQNGNATGDLIAVIQAMRNDMRNLKLIVDKKVFGAAVVDYGGEGMKDYIGSADLSEAYGYGS